MKCIYEIEVIDCRLNLKDEDGNVLYQFVGGNTSVSYNATTLVIKDNVTQATITINGLPNINGGAFATIEDLNTFILSELSGCECECGGSSSLQWYAENSAAPTIPPVATGSGSIALGSGAEAVVDGMFVYGESAGNNATAAYFSNFIGFNAGQNATDAYYSNFLGQNAGYSATNSNNSNFIGFSAGKDATNANNSNFLGQNAGQNATDAYSSNFIGASAGQDATNSRGANFIGNNAGSNATNANNSNFIGEGAGYNATNAQHSNFFGNSSGSNATNANNSNFIGEGAGYNATNANGANFFGTNAGRDATYASNSNFLGQNAGQDATNADYSIFIGNEAGNGANKANNSIFIGKDAGLSDIVDNSSGGTSILIGDETSTGGFPDSIAIGAGATNTKSNQLLISSIIQNFFLTLPAYDNDADAAANGLVSNEWYKTTGLGAAPLNVAGIVMIRQ